MNTSPFVCYIGGGELRKLIEGLGKLALTDYKAYLRSNGLRLSGTKEECIQRIIEHWRYVLV